MNIDLNALLVFFEVVNSQSITKAARTLGLPKSTVSRKIRHLEDQVGSKLLKRGNRRIAVTESGHRLNEHCARIAAEVEGAGLQAVQMRTSLKGRLRVSMPIDFGTGWLTRAIASFAETYSEIELDIHVNGRWVDVSEESYDIAIHIGRLMNPDLPFRRLSALTRGLYASPEYAARRGLPNGHWRDHECILTEQQLAEGIWNLGGNGQGELRRQARVVVNNIGVARELVISGLGLGILPNVMCRNDVRSGRLVRAPLSRDIPPLEACATFFSGRNIPRKTKVFIDHIADFLASDEVQLLDRRDALQPVKKGAPARGNAMAPRRRSNARPVRP